MDWLEEKIEQLLTFLKDSSLVKALVWYLSIGMCGVGTFYWITRNICRVWIEVLSKRYDNIITTHSVRGWNWFDIGGKGQLLLSMINFLYNCCLYLYILICFYIVGKLFLEKKIKPAIAAISQGMNYINMGDYSHEITWRGKDEMGILCEELEQLRKKMLKNKRDQWKYQEEQRKINAAFAHDIRTPLTVIQGYTEFLQKYVPKGRVTEGMLMEKLNTMHEQEERLLLFSTTMTKIQNIEKWELSGNWYHVSELVERLDAVIQGILEKTDKEISLCAKIPEKELFLDRNLLMEVFENLLSNALRYASGRIQVEAALGEKELTIYVKDDGPGFSVRALCSGMEAYFSEEKDSREHFGIGLSICRILCENHGGTLTLQNSVEQGAITAATLAVGIREM